jgi:TRAP-type uncharacterized transport system substrate-binding protein
MRIGLGILLGLLIAWPGLATRCLAQNSAMPFEVAQVGPRGGPTAAASGEQAKVTQVNNWTVGIAGGFFEGTFIRFAVDLAKALDDGDRLRILPIVSYGGNENVSDLLYMKGIDLTIAYTDTLEFYRKSGQVKNIEQRINYISELLNGELYIFARPEIKTLKDLEGKKVNLGTKGNSATTTGPIIFDRLGIHPQFQYTNNTIAIEQMKTGDIDALVHSGGKPNEFFRTLRPEPGFHFVPIEYSTKFSDFYVPCPLSHEDYPQLIEAGTRVDTLCMLAVLAVYNFPKQSDRFRRVERFIQSYFDHFDRLMQPSYHPKWKEVNLAAKVPGWNRYFVAEEKLAAMADATATSKHEDAGLHPADSLPVSKQDASFQKFMEWRQNQEKKN